MSTLLACPGFHVLRLLRAARGAPARLLTVSAALYLGGCMTLGDSEPPPAAPPSPPQVASIAPAEPAVPPTVPKPTPRKVSRAPRAAEPPVSRPERAAVNPKTLIGLDQAGVRRVLGQPAGIRTDHLSLTWTYRGPGCAMQVVFYPSLEDASFHVLKFASSDADGKPADISDACISHILLARSNAH
jgi:hypothetical protein